MLNITSIGARSYEVLNVLNEALPSTKNVVVKDNTAKGVTPKSPKFWEGRNSLNTCSNGANEESIGI